MSERGVVPAERSGPDDASDASSQPLAAELDCSDLGATT